MSSDLTAMRRNAVFAAKRMSEILSSRLADFSMRAFLDARFRRYDSGKTPVFEFLRAKALKTAKKARDLKPVFCSHI